MKLDTLIEEIKEGKVTRPSCEQVALLVSEEAYKNCKAMQDAGKCVYDEQCQCLKGEF